MVASINPKGGRRWGYPKQINEASVWTYPTPRGEAETYLVRVKRMTVLKQNENTYMRKVERERTRRRCSYSAKASPADDAKGYGAPVERDTGLSVLVGTLYVRNFLAYFQGASRDDCYGTAGIIWKCRQIPGNVLVILGRRILDENQGFPRIINWSLQPFSLPSCKNE